MSVESDDSDVFDEYSKAMPSALSTAASCVQDAWGQRRLTSVFVVNASELAQLGWYHALYHLDDVLLVGTSGSAADAVDAVSSGWADLVLIDREVDLCSGRWVEQTLANKPLAAHYVFTADHALEYSPSRVDPVKEPTMSTGGGVSEIVASLRSSIDQLFNDEIRLRGSGHSLGMFPDGGRIEARVRGNN